MKTKNTFSFGTIILIILGLILPLWPITLPLFWYLAYLSYRRGVDPVVNNATPVREIAEAQALLNSGAITQQEFDSIKARIINSP